MPWRNDATPRNTMKPNATKSANLDGKSGVLHGAHMGGHSDVSAPQTKTTKPKPNPTPTSVSQLKNTISTMMNKGETVTAGSKADPNIYRGSYNGSDWSISQGKTSRIK